MTKPSFLGLTSTALGTRAAAKLVPCHLFKLPDTNNFTLLVNETFVRLCLTQKGTSCISMGCGGPRDIGVYLKWRKSVLEPQCIMGHQLSRYSLAITFFCYLSKQMEQKVQTWSASIPSPWLNSMEHEDDEDRNVLPSLLQFTLPQPWLALP